MSTFSFLAAILLSFLTGSIMFSQILPQKLMGTDIAALSDDHNPGATNVFVNCGPSLGLLCLFLDLAKGFLPVYLGCKFMDTDNLLFGLILAAPVLGHAIAPLNHLKGGKCIACAFGAMLGIIPLSAAGLVILASLYILFSVILKIRPNRVASMITFALFGCITGFYCLYHDMASAALGSCLIAVTAFIKHTRLFCKN